MEPFYFALGLGVAGVAVLLDDPEHGQQVFEGVLSAAEAGGVHPAVVGQCGGGEAVFFGGGQESGGDGFTGDRDAGGTSQQVSGVVIEPVQDLNVGAIGQAPVGEV